jgi:hypothetical protein
MTRWMENVALAAAAVVVMALHITLAGRLDVSGGLGWDGQGYARMLRSLWEGTANMQLRPALPLLTRPAYWWFGEPIAAFTAMNYVYLAVLTMVLGLIADRYDIGRWAKVYLLVTLSLCVSVTQMFAYYPALIDLGAYAVIATTLYAVLRGWRLAAALLAVLCVFSRELSLAIIAFGLVRDVRLRARWWKPIVTYVPAAVIAVQWRMSITGTPGDQILSAYVLAGNLRLWLDPIYVGLFVYFVFMMFGGVSLLVMTNPRRSFALFREEPEWLAFVVVVLAISAVGDADIWRYLAYSLPAFVVLFARCCRDWTPRQQVLMFALGALVTWITQTPFDAMDSELYFIDWFPYYMRKEMVEQPALVWPLWAWRLLFAVAAIWIVSATAAALVRRDARSTA